MEGRIEEDVEEANKEMDVGEAPPIGESAPEQVLAPPATFLTIAEIWASGPSGQVAGQGLTASKRARGKAPAIQVE